MNEALTGADFRVWSKREFHIKKAIFMNENFNVDCLISFTFMFWQVRICFGRNKPVSTLADLILISLAKKSIFRKSFQSSLARNFSCWSKKKSSDLEQVDGSYQMMRIINRATSATNVRSSFITIYLRMRLAVEGRLIVRFIHSWVG